MYAGEVPHTDGTYPMSNTLCHYGGMEGLIDCGSSISTSYIIFAITAPSQALGFAEILAWNQPLISVTASDLTLTGISYTGGGPLSRMFGQNDSTDNDCAKFSGAGSMDIVLPAGSTVGSIFVQGYYAKSNWGIDLIGVQVFDSGAAW